MADIEDSYKYLGILQADCNLEQATMEAAAAEYLEQVRQVLGEHSGIPGSHHLTSQLEGPGFNSCQGRCGC